MNIQRPNMESAAHDLLRAPKMPPIVGSYTSDYPADYDLDFDGRITDIREPVAAVALTGSLLPASYAFVVPANRRRSLVDWSLASVGVNAQQWMGHQTAATLSNSPLRIPSEILTIYPGDVVSLGRVSPEGVSVYIPSPRFQHHPTQDFRRFRPEPYIRSFRTTDALPSRIGYRRIPQWISVSAGSAAPTAIPAGNGSTGFGVSGCTHVRLSFQDNVNTATAIVGAETADYDIWWQDASGLWLHHHDDDLDAAGRGSITATHNAEVYDVQAGITGICIVKTAGDTLFCNIVAFDASGAYSR